MNEVKEIVVVCDSFYKDVFEGPIYLCLAFLSYVCGIIFHLLNSVCCITITMLLLLLERLQLIVVHVSRCWSQDISRC